MKPERPGAYLFDLDGVLTPTADIHRIAWTRTFDEFFAQLEAPGGADVSPFTDADYFGHVDGRPRYEGVRALLAARGVTLPTRAGAGAPGFDSVEGLGDLKQEEFLRELARHPIRPYSGAVELIESIREVPKAVVSSSKNARQVLESAGLLDDFPVIVDGLVAVQEGLAGKPSPETFLYASALLGVDPAESCVLEDALSGVAAARAGGFGLVLGVDRGVGEAALLSAGAHRVVRELDELLGEAR